MPAEPDIKRAVSFIDGQNLYRHAKDAFGHHHPNYDPIKLADAVCASHGWVSAGVRFYTGVPSAHRAPMWHGYWNRRLTAMRRAGIAVTSRPLRYRVETVRLPDGSVHELPVEREKGVDLRLGLDIVRMARNAELDVAILFSVASQLVGAQRMRGRRRSEVREGVHLVGIVPEPRLHQRCGQAARAEQNQRDRARGRH